MEGGKQLHPTKKGPGRKHAQGKGKSVRAPMWPDNTSKKWHLSSAAVRERKRANDKWGFSHD